MALDPSAKLISFGFPGGALTGKIGTLQAIFGEDLVAQSMQGTANVSVKAHTRTRVIGGPSTSVSGTNYTLKKFPTGRRGGALGGEPIAFLVGDNYWTVRLSGSHQDLNSWLETAPGTGDEPFVWVSEKDTPYGPFAAPVYAD